MIVPSAMPVALLLLCGLSLSGLVPSRLAIADTSTAEVYEVDARTGFRMERYRAPVPRSVPGGVTLDTADVRERLAAGTLVAIDVYPPRGLGADPLDGSWLVSEPHATIAGATWLPEVGRGFLTDEHVDYFRRNLDRLSGGDRSTPMVFFCNADCWQSWNAAKRAADWGYNGVHWYPLGTDGWLEEGGTLVAARPLNFLDDSLPDGTGLAGNASDDPGDDSGDAPAIGSTGHFPEQARITLVDGDGNETDIGSVRFDSTVAGTGESGGERIAIDVTIEGEAFSDHFLSMRPFRCIAEASEWLCHLPYPYTLGDTVTSDDLTDLEYRLLFIIKGAGEFGIDAWNGVYYRLEPDGAGGFVGALLEGDLNVLAAPPSEPDARPIDLAEFIGDEASRRRFPTLLVRP